MGLVRLIKPAFPSWDAVWVSGSHGGQKSETGHKLVRKFCWRFDGGEVCSFQQRFAQRATGEILLRTVVTPRFICQMDPFYWAGILISQSVYHGQEGKNKMGHSRFCREICFTVYNGCAKGFCWNVILTLSFTRLPFLSDFSKLMLFLN